VSHERELGVDPLLECVEPQLFQTLDLRVCERLVSEVGIAWRQSASAA
jgi:hypothetical protein